MLLIIRSAKHLIPYKIIFGELPKALHPKAYIKLDPDD